VVLAGGSSVRFGHDKLSEPYRGTPLLHHAVRRLVSVCEEVVVVAAPGVDPPLPTDARVRTTHDVIGGEGPLAGAYAGLLAVRTELALVAGGDMPDLQASVLREMVRVAEGSSAEAVVLRDGERFRPLPSVLRAGRALDVAHALLHVGERRLRSLLAALQVAVVEEATWTALDPERRTLLDIDEPADLER
jgi:molybdopterin-guanine dinucleotide biosynthesis protein A